MTIIEPKKGLIAIVGWTYIFAWTSVFIWRLALGKELNPGDIAGIVMNTIILFFLIIDDMSTSKNGFYKKIILTHDSIRLESRSSADELQRDNIAEIVIGIRHWKITTSVNQYIKIDSWRLGRTDKREIRNWLSACHLQGR